MSHGATTLAACIVRFRCDARQHAAAAVIKVGGGGGRMAKLAYAPPAVVVYVICVPGCCLLPKHLYVNGDKPSEAPRQFAFIA